ncbi:MAG: response regulator [Planctomycetales bacterium]|nr:response regulator [Planctomycetales bacterium]NIM09987.1 response regulator [Planctomycetales bacterium]NIN09425.1 response regulator [Planctomycetales bacterium]NIN78532.1 response regulator [Planctomycetales bacterium]NIO35725.1 response regulator [Planctomycetales bacterium]
MNSDSTVFLVDDDQSLREALEWLLESVELPVEVFASAAEFLANYDPARPGCLVLDIRMPGMSGLELQKQLNLTASPLPVIVITGHGDVPTCVRAFEGGAFGFLEKPVNHQDFLDHIQRAIEHDRKNRRTAGGQPRLQAKIETLTPREREVMELLASGKTMKQISKQLDISFQTCSKHRARVLEKLDVDTDVELVRLLLTATSDGNAKS